MCLHPFPRSVYRFRFRPAQPLVDVSAFVLWMRGGLARLQRDPAAALLLLGKAAGLSAAMPPLTEWVAWP